MAERISASEFDVWEPQQMVRFGQIYGRPFRLPEAAQANSRLARAKHIARLALGKDESALWLTAPNLELNGLAPEAFASESEEGCKRVLRLLVALARLAEATYG